MLTWQPTGNFIKSALNDDDDDDDNDDDNNNNNNSIKLHLLICFLREKLPSVKIVQNKCNRVK